MLDVTASRLRVRIDLAEGAPIVVEVRGERFLVGPGETLEVQLTSAREGPISCNG
jgi:hypothetical protein